VHDHDNANMKIEAIKKLNNQPTMKTATELNAISETDFTYKYTKLRLSRH